MAKTQDVLPGGMIAIRLEDQEIVICNIAGRFYAFNRRCGHENAPLNFGTLNGHIVTCPLHFAQFDVRTGKALLGPGNKDYGKGKPVTPKPKDDSMPKFQAMIFKEMSTHDLRSYEVKVENGEVFVDTVCRDAQMIKPQ